MPIYEYKCTECSNEFEEIRPVRDNSLPRCPKCDSEKTEKKFSLFGSAGGSSNTGSSCGSSAFT